MINSKIKALITLLFLIAFTWFSSLQLSTPEPALPGYSPDSYSAYRAIEHLKIIAKEPHAGGTKAHKRVRNFIYDFCKARNLEVKVTNLTGMQEYGSTAVAGNAFNILAKVAGSASSKAVLVMAHYDSQPNTPGAADDGSGVASMLEVIDLLSKKENLKNDVYFLFTDLEEIGLLGAEAFVDSNNVLSDVGMILNFEARGNSGVNFTFEISSENGWLVREFSNAVDKPLAYSLAYEIYKLMPNDTDFTRFTETGIPGLNTAYIDGHVYYHSPADTHQNIDMGSLQHQGDLMWQMVNHFGNLDLTNTKSEDAIFFSLFNFLVIYPVGLDIPLIAITLISLIVLIITSIKKSRSKISNLVKAFFSYLLIIILSVGIAWILNWIVLSINPHYSSFYNSNFYNGPVYFWMFLGSTLLVFTVAQDKLLNDLNTLEKAIGAFIMHGVLIVIFKAIVPTGPYILYVPLLLTILLLLYQVLKDQNYQFTNSLLLPILPIVMFTPFIYVLFIVFSLSLPFASILFTLFLLPYLQFGFEQINILHKYLMISIAALIFITAVLVGQLTSAYSEEQPLQSFLTYALNRDTDEAFWVSNQKQKDVFVDNYIKNEEQTNLAEIFPTSTRLYWKDSAPSISLKSANIAVLSDTIVESGRTVSLEIRPKTEANYFYLILPEGVIIDKVNERMTNGTTNFLIFYAAGKLSTTVQLRTAIAESVAVTLIESQLEIKEELLSTPWPNNMIPGTGRLSNNMLVKKTIML